MPINIAPFKPFSLAESIQAGQAIKMNQLKLQAAQSQMAREQQLRGLAAMSTAPTYGGYKQPDEQTFPGEAPIPGLKEQTGTEYSPEVHAQKLARAGEIEMAAEIRDNIAKMDEAQRKDAADKTEQIARLAVWADTPEKWDQANQEAMDRGLTTEPVPFDQRDLIITKAQTVSDLMKTSSSKAPKTRNIRQGKDIVNQEWDDSTQSWKEVGRGPMSQQQINLRNTPSEAAAGKEFEDVLTQANTAEDQLATIDRAKALIPDIEEGKLEPIKAWARQWADAVGVSVDTQKMSDAVSFNATMKTAVLDGMKAIKGTASEADRKTVEDSVAALENPEDANKFLLDTAESLAKRNIERADFYDKWATDHEGSLLGVRRAWSKHIHNVPLLRRVKGKTFHYYQFRDQLIQANKNAFAGATEDEINAEVNRQWKMGK